MEIKGDNTTVEKLYFAAKEATEGQIKQLSQTERKTLMAALKSLQGSKPENMPSETEMQALTAKLKNSNITNKPSSRLASMEKKVSNFFGGRIGINQIKEEIVSVKSKSEQTYTESNKNFGEKLELKKDKIGEWTDVLAAELKGQAESIKKKPLSKEDEEDEQFKKEASSLHEEMENFVKALPDDERLAKPYREKQLEIIEKRIEEANSKGEYKLSNILGEYKKLFKRDSLRTEGLTIHQEMAAFVSSLPKDEKEAQPFLREQLKIIEQRMKERPLVEDKNGILVKDKVYIILEKYKNLFEDLLERRVADKQDVIKGQKKKLQDQKEAAPLHKAILEFFRSLPKDHEEAMPLLKSKLQEIEKQIENSTSENEKKTLREHQQSLKSLIDYKKDQNWKKDFSEEVTGQQIGYENAYNVCTSPEKIKGIEEEITKLEGELVEAKRKQQLERLYKP